MRTSVENTRGRPEYCIDGRPVAPVFCSTPPAFMQNFIDAGFRIFDTHPYVHHGWMGPDHYDYTCTDRYIESYLEQDPNALLILRFWMGYAVAEAGEPNMDLEKIKDERRAFWWSRENPEELARATHSMEGFWPASPPSFASLKWREESGEAMRRAVVHIEEKYGDHVFAYVPGGGLCGEDFHWLTYCSGENGDNLDDYSKPMQRAFQNHLREKYATIEHLNRVWGASLPDFDAVAVPDARSRLQASRGILRDPGREQAVIDWYEIYNRQVADTLLHWARMIKEGCGDNRIVMAFYGYLWMHHSGQSVTRSGHIHLDEVASSPHVDAIVAPFHYSFRQVDGVFSGQTPVASVIRRGTQYVHEIDTSTHNQLCWCGSSQRGPRNVDETLSALRRDVGRQLCEGSTGWIMDLSGGLYDGDPELIRELGRLVTEWTRLGLCPSRNNRQVAVVVDPRETFYFPEAEDFLMPLYPVFKQFELERMGLGYDDLILNDLEALSPEETEQYRLWIFPSSVHMDDRKRALIRRHACRNGNLVLWIYGVGVAASDGPSTQDMEAITGFEVGLTEEPGEVVVEVGPGEHPVLEGIRETLVYGTRGALDPDTIRKNVMHRIYPTSAEGFHVSPRFHISGGGTILGKALDLNADGGGLALRNMGDWTSVLSVAPLVPGRLLRNLARAAGCHVYTDFPGQSFQCEGVFGLYTHADGTCRIAFPGRGIIRNLWTSEVLCPDGDVLEFETDAYRCHLLSLE